jgi:hypothetical protein
MLHTHHLSSEAGTVGQLVAYVPSGVSLNSPQETKKAIVSLKSHISIHEVDTIASTLFFKRSVFLSEADTFSHSI